MIESPAAAPRPQMAKGGLHLLEIRPIQVGVLRALTAAIIAIFTQVLPAPAASALVAISASESREVVPRKDRSLAHVEPAQSAAGDSIDRAKTAAAVDVYLRHIYSVYLGLRACTEMSTEQNDRSFLPSLTIEEARKTLKSIDAATAEVKINSDASWTAAAPRAEVTAEALKADPVKHLGFCQKMGGLFRVDESNLQALLNSLGAKTLVIKKDY